MFMITSPTDERVQVRARGLPRKWMPEIIGSSGSRKTGFRQKRAAPGDDRPHGRGRDTMRGRSEREAGCQKEPLMRAYAPLLLVPVLLVQV